MNNIAKVSFHYDYQNEAKYKNIRLMNKSINHSFSSNEQRQNFVDERAKLEANNFYLTFDNNGKPVYEYGKDINRVKEVEAKLLQDLEPIQKVWNKTSAWKHDHVSFDEALHGATKKHLFDEAIFQIGDPDTKFQNDISKMSDKEKMKLFKQEIEIYKQSYKEATGYEPHIAGITGHADETSFHLHIITSNLYETKNGTPTFKNPVSKRDELIHLREVLNQNLRQELEPKYKDLEIERYEAPSIPQMSKEQYQKYRQEVRENSKKGRTLQDYKREMEIVHKNLFNEIELKQVIEVKQNLIVKSQKQLAHKYERKAQLLDYAIQQNNEYKQAKRDYQDIDKEISNRYGEKSDLSGQDRELQRQINEAGLLAKKKLKQQQLEVKAQIEQVQKAIDELRPKQYEAQDLMNKAKETLSSTLSNVQKASLEVSQVSKQLDEAKQEAQTFVDEAHISMNQHDSINELDPTIEQMVNSNLNDMEQSFKDQDEDLEQKRKEQELKEQQLDLEPEMR